ncbi:hypothetical protein GIB67_010301 [Kingdonia uniflora]|uniref:Uncharacterized protein n=1 Tax=Kingdonia uniflora TaxID=39325 RepID=A0A7J7LCR0_9MAGN|nr:hypothetical protein GIB67_010301 [Kingdonia uniflora]
MNELKDKVCSSWFAPVGSASDYPLLSKWVIYGELGCNGSCTGQSDGISPIYSLWATFIGLYMANYVVERSSGEAGGRRENEQFQKVQQVRLEKTKEFTEEVNLHINEDIKCKVLNAHEVWQDRRLEKTMNKSVDGWQQKEGDLLEKPIGFVANL